MPKWRTKPRYLYPRQNKDGSTRYYWAPKDRPPVRLSNDPEKAWQEAEAKNQARDREIGKSGRVAGEKLEGTLAWWISAFRHDPDFTDRAHKTRKEYGKILQWLEKGFGDLKPDAVDAQWVQALKRKGAGRPWQTNARIRVIRLLYNWARRNGHWHAANPAEGFKQLRTPPRHVVWSGEQLGAFMKAARPSMQLAMLLGLFTLQREGDLIALPWSAYNGLRIELRQSKTGKLITAKAHKELKAMLDAIPKRAVQVLVSEATDKPYDEHHFRHVFAQDREKAKLPSRLQFRDLRRTGAVVLARRGETPQRIGALGGWTLSRAQKILETYIPLDAEMADQAVAAFESAAVVAIK